MGSICGIRFQDRMAGYHPRPAFHCFLRSQSSVSFHAWELGRSCTIQFADKEASETPSDLAKVDGL